MDISDNILVKQGLVPGNYTSNQSSPGSVDTQGYHNAAVVVTTGSVDGSDGDETYDIEVYEADNSGMSSASKIATVSFDDNSSDENVELVRLDEVSVARERYIETRLVTGGTSPSIDLGIAVLLGDAVNAPVGNSVTDA